MVLWSFFGIRRNASAAEELGRMNPFGLLGTAAAVLAVMGLTLLGLAHLAVRLLQ
jgi:hypothetical protein